MISLLISATIGFSTGTFPESVTTGTSGTSGTSGTTGTSSVADMSTLHHASDLRKQDEVSINRGAVADEGEHSPWRTRPHLGVELHYSGASASMEDSNRVIRQIAGAEQFGFAHGGELTLVYTSPGRIQARVGVGALYDTGSSPVTVPVVNSLTGQQVGTTQAKVTGHAVGITVPILVGYRYDFWEERLSASLEGGVELMPFSRLSCSVEGASGGCSPLSGGFSAGGTARLGFAWHIVPQLALSVGFVWRTLESGNLRFSGAPNDYEDDMGRTSQIDFSGVGFRTGIGGYFF